LATKKRFDHVVELVALQRERGEGGEKCWEKKPRARTHAQNADCSVSERSTHLLMGSFHKNPARWWRDLMSSSDDILRRN
jgi:hypothetical protein